MQGRLSPQINGKIQAFPKEDWRREFELAGRYGFSLIEWTLDQEGLRENPLLTPEGRREIRALCDQYRVEVRSVTCDNFMQAPFYKLAGRERELRIEELRSIMRAAAELEIRFLVLPVVDNGRLENLDQRVSLHDGLVEMVPLIRSGNLKIAFETDLPPTEVKEWIESFPEDCFGINYDMGNSASLGYVPQEEFRCYGHRIWNVHVKDRLLGGGTVPLGEGAADFGAIVQSLKAVDYRGNYILQTARATDGNHLGVLLRYKELVNHWINS